MATGTIEQMRELVCEKCPATNWGKKAICRIHEIHIGKVESCPEWEKQTVENRQIKEASAPFIYGDVEPAMEWLQRTIEAIDDYQWHLNEISKLKEYLAEAGEGMTGAYGIGASLPKTKGLPSDKTQREAMKRETFRKRLIKLEESVKKVELALQSITNEKHRVILECMLDRIPKKEIYRHIGVSKSYFHVLQKQLIRQMAWLMYGEDQQAG